MKFKNRHWLIYRVIAGLVALWVAVQLRCEWHYKVPLSATKASCSTFQKSALFFIFLRFFSRRAITHFCLNPSRYMG
ncbi:hypothetical protein B9G39_29750 [Zooshikella ganghwensis]|uniref:Uncharacterized protein n=1 Tax=Zooshikella ganghwensis TaxID=202772 RepID=A0A4P9VFT7_9GAMM|nr:hypothetical protein B9G39_29750 [Zooshikella ganghwensis]